MIEKYHYGVFGKYTQEEMDKDWDWWDSFSPGFPKKLQALFQCPAGKIYQDIKTLVKEEIFRVPSLLVWTPEQLQYTEPYYVIGYLKSFRDTTGRPAFRIFFIAIPEEIYSQKYQYHPFSLVRSGFLEKMWQSCLPDQPAERNISRAKALALPESQKMPEVPEKIKKTIEEMQFLFEGMQSSMVLPYGYSQWSQALGLLECICSHLPENQKRKLSFVSLTKFHPLESKQKLNLFFKIVGVPGNQSQEKLESLKDYECPLVLDSAKKRTESMPKVESLKKRTESIPKANAFSNKYASSAKVDFLQGIAGIGNPFGLSVLFLYMQSNDKEIRNYAFSLFSAFYPKYSINIQNQEILSTEIKEQEKKEILQGILYNSRDISSDLKSLQEQGSKNSLLFTAADFWDIFFEVAEKHYDESTRKEAKEILVFLQEIKQKEKNISAPIKTDTDITESGNFLSDCKEKIVDFLKKDSLAKAKERLSLFFSKDSLSEYKEKALDCKKKIASLCTKINKRQRVFFGASLCFLLFLVVCFVFFQNKQEQEKNFQNMDTKITALQKEVEKISISDNLNELNKNLDGFSEIRKTFKSISEETNHKKKEIEEAKVSLLSSKLGDVQRKIDEKETELENKKKSIEEKEKNFRELDGKIAALQTDIDAITIPDTLNDLEKNLANLSIITIRFQKISEEAKQKKIELEKRLSEVQKNIDIKTTKLESKKKSIEEKDKNFLKLDGELTTLQMDIDAITIPDILNDLEKKLANLSIITIRYQKVSEEAKQKKIELEKRLSDVQKNIDAKKTEIEKKKKSIQEKEKNFQKLDGEIAALQTDIAKIIIPDNLNDLEKNLANLSDITIRYQKISKEVKHKKREIEEDKIFLLSKSSGDVQKSIDTKKIELESKKNSIEEKEKEKEKNFQELDRKIVTLQKDVDAITISGSLNELEKDLKKLKEMAQESKTILDEINKKLENGKLDLNKSKILSENLENLEKKIDTKEKGLTKKRDDILEKNKNYENIKKSIETINSEIQIMKSESEEHFFDQQIVNISGMEKRSDEIYAAIWQNNINLTLEQRNELSMECKELKDSLSLKKNTLEEMDKQYSKEITQQLEEKSNEFKKLKNILQQDIIKAKKDIKYFDFLEKDLEELLNSINSLNIIETRLKNKSYQNLITKKSDLENNIKDTIKNLGEQQKERYQNYKKHIEAIQSKINKFENIIAKVSEEELGSTETERSQIESKLLQEFLLKEQNFTELSKELKTFKENLLQISTQAKNYKTFKKEIEEILDNNTEEFDLKIEKISQIKVNLPKELLKTELLNSIEATLQNLRNKKLEQEQKKEKNYGRLKTNLEEILGNNAEEFDSKITKLSKIKSDIPEESLKEENRTELLNSIEAALQNLKNQKQEQEQRKEENYGRLKTNLEEIIRSNTEEFAPKIEKLSLLSSKISKELLTESHRRELSNTMNQNLQTLQNLKKKKEEQEKKENQERMRIEPIIKNIKMDLENIGIEKFSYVYSDEKLKKNGYQDTLGKIANIKEKIQALPEKHRIEYSNYYFDKLINDINEKQKYDKKWHENIRNYFDNGKISEMRQEIKLYCQSSLHAKRMETQYKTFLESCVFEIKIYFDRKGNDRIASLSGNVQFGKDTMKKKKAFFFNCAEEYQQILLGTITTGIPDDEDKIIIEIACKHNRPEHNNYKSSSESDIVRMKEITIGSTWQKEIEKSSSKKNISHELPYDYKEEWDVTTHSVKKNWGHNIPSKTLPLSYNHQVSLWFAIRFISNPFPTFGN
ncbi:MAG: hypothetical protein HUU50_00175 [Candidatus Brocadiae bacterium]|nr:hypothetical protein [Candidatus Brocadiia bacterium]